MFRIKNIVGAATSLLGTRWPSCGSRKMTSLHTNIISSIVPEVANKTDTTFWSDILLPPAYPHEDDPVYLKEIGGH